MQKILLHIFEHTVIHFHKFVTEFDVILQFHHHSIKNTNMYMLITI